MKLCHCLFLFISIVPLTIVRSQTAVRLFSKEFQAIPEQHKIVVLGENHVRKNFIQQSDAIKYFCEVRGFKHVFFEVGGAYEVSFRNYVLGLSNELHETELWSSDDQISRCDMQLLEVIRKINADRSPSEKVQVHCYEIFGETFEQDFRKGILSLFPDTTKITSMPWFSVLKEDGYIEECDLFHVWWHLKIIKENDCPSQYGMTDAQWHRLIRVAKEIEIAYRMYSTDEHDEVLAWRNREIQLYSNIIECADLLTGAVIFCGANHAVYNGGITEDGLLKKRLVEMLKTDFKESVCSILPQYVRLSLIDLYLDMDISNAMPYDLAKGRIKRNEYIRLISNTEIPTQAYAKDKCDYVIIINCQKTRKVYRRHKRYGLPRMTRPFSDWFRLRSLTSYFYEPDEWGHKPGCNL